MDGGRLLTLKGKNLVIKGKKKNLLKQSFVYDSQSQTILALSKQGYSLNTKSYKRGDNLEAARTKNSLRQKFTL